jgi:hypothetical protein
LVAGKGDWEAKVGETACRLPDEGKERYRDLDKDLL